MTLEEEIREKNDLAQMEKESPDYLYVELIETIREYHPSEDFSLIEKAYRLANDAHKGVKRKSGEPYIIHPLHVAIILAKLQMDKETIAAGILHDVIEDTQYSYDDIVNIFSKEIAELVDGVTKLTNLELKDIDDKESEQAENLRKMFLAMAKDIRVIIIKLADRLHNMRTLQHMKPHKQLEKSRETLEIYSPLASKLGISKVKCELDDYALSYLYPDEFKKIKNYVDLHAPERDKFIEDIITEVKAKLHEEAEIDPIIYGRIKHVFSIYKKMLKQQKELDDIYDIFAIRIIVDSIRDCYAALGVIHEMYTPVPTRFKDYIAMKKPNGYQSLHTTVVSESGARFEVQIRTKEMHRIAEYGIAAHWRYKEGKVSAEASEAEKAELDKMNWLRDILELQQNSSNSEFVHEVKNELNLFSETVFCFTPQGKCLNLPAGSSVIDFAYRIHTDVGNKMVGAVVNGKVVPITYKLQTGDRVQINTSGGSRGPSRDWIKECKSPQARNKIRQWFKTKDRAYNIEQGMLLLERYCKLKGYVFSEFNTQEARDNVMKKYSFLDWDSVLASVGYGDTKEGQVINRMRDVFVEKKTELTDAEAEERMKSAADRNKSKSEELQKTQPSGYRSGQFIIKSYANKGSYGKSNDLISCAHCCDPLPGDPIFGFVTRNRGIKVHRKDCANFASFSDAEKGRTIEVEWAETKTSAEENKASFTVELAIFAQDRKGMIAAISQTLAENGFDIEYFHTDKSKKGIATINVRISVESKDSLAYIMKKLDQISGVVDVKRNN